LHDTREKNPMLVNMLHYKGAFNRIQMRHEIWKTKYPDWPATRGPAFTGLANARPETEALSEVPAYMQNLPFDPLEYIEYDPPFDLNGDPDLGE
jgi:arylsulfatase